MFVIFAVTYRCPLRCRHCYARGGEQDGGVFDLEKSKILITSLLRSSFFSKYGLNIVFHGGEPLLMGYDYYKDLLETFSDEIISGKLKISIQTSLVPLLLQFNRNEFSLLMKWVDLFRKYNVGISSSFDLTENEEVRLRNLPDTFWDLVRILQEEGLTPGFVTLVYNRKQGISGRKLLDYFVSKGINQVRINPLKKSGRSTVLPEDYFDIDYYWEVMGEVVDLYYTEGYRNIILVEPVKTVEEIIVSYISGYGNRRVGCPFSIRCSFGVCAVSSYGDLMLCGEAVAHPEFRHCSLDLTSVEACSESLRKGVELIVRHVSERISELTEEHPCTNCDFFYICQGGCYLQNFHIYRKYGHFYCERPLIENIMTYLSGKKSKESLSERI